MQNVKNKILLLNLITLLPVVFFLFYLNIDHFKESEKVEIENLKNVTSIVASENDQVIENVKHLLTTISTLPEIQNPNDNCNTLLFNVVSKYQRYGNIGVANNNGIVVCSAVATTEKINLSDRYFFKETINNKSFSTGEYVISRSTGKSSINFGYPLNDGGIVYATLNLDWLNNLIANIDIDKNLVVLVLDKEGVVLARYPESNTWVGEEFPNKNFDKNIIETTGLDRINRIYSVKPLNKDVGPYILVGQTKESIYIDSRKNLAKQLIITIVIAFFSIYTGLLVGKSLIIKTIDKLKELDNLRKDFISLISHQIRTPATSIKWFTEILLRDSKDKLNLKQRRILKDTYISVKRMIELIGNILSITKLENGKIELVKSEVNLNQMIADILKQVSKEFKSKNIKHNLTCHPKILKIKVDEKLFYQAIYNLIHNAFKYSDKEELVEIDVKKTNDMVNIKVKDNGIGIPLAERDNIFAKFSRATNAKIVDTEGAGLGLYLSKLIINTHGGEIRLGNTKTGTLVLVTIPLI